MSPQILFFQITISFLAHFLVQVLFVHNLELFGIAFCFVYINFILILPLQINRNLLLLLAFAIGFLIDGFYDTLGIHTLASVLIAYIRPFLVDALSTKVEITELNITNTGLYWFITYCLVLIGIHHLLIFFLQQFNFRMFFETFIRATASSLFTLLAIILIQYFFYSNYRNAR